MYIIYRRALAENGSRVSLWHSIKQSTGALCSSVHERRSRRPWRRAPMQHGTKTRAQGCATAEPSHARRVSLTRHSINAATDATARSQESRAGDANTAAWTGERVRPSLRLMNDWLEPAGDGEKTCSSSGGGGGGSGRLFQKRVQVLCAPGVGFQWHSSTRAAKERPGKAGTFPLSLSLCWPFFPSRRKKVAGGV